MKIELTKDQCKNLALFIEINLLHDIRSDPEMDNLDYLRDMLNIQQMCREAAKHGDK